MVEYTPYKRSARKRCSVIEPNSDTSSNNIDKAVNTLSYVTELEEMSFYNLKLRDRAAEFLRDKGMLSKNNGNDHAFRKMHGLGNYWYVFVDIDSTETYKIEVVIFKTVEIGKEEIKWFDVNVLDVEDDAWKDIPKYLEERYSIVVHPKSSK